MASLAACMFDENSESCSFQARVVKLSVLFELGLAEYPAGAGVEDELNGDLHGYVCFGLVMVLVDQICDINHGACHFFFSLLASLTGVLAKPWVLCWWWQEANAYLDCRH